MILPKTRDGGWGYRFNPYKYGSHTMEKWIMKEKLKYQFDEGGDIMKVSFELLFVCISTSQSEILGQIIQANRQISY